MTVPLFHLIINYIESLYKPKKYIRRILVVLNKHFFVKNDILLDIYIICITTVDGKLYFYNFCLLGSKIYYAMNSLDVYPLTDTVTYLVVFLLEFVKKKVIL